MYGSMVIGYLFLGGTAAGALFVMALWSLLRAVSYSKAKPSPRSVRAFETLQKRVLTLAFLLLLFAVALLFWDLGRPERVWIVFFSPHVTVLTFGAFCLSFELAIACLLAARSLLGIGPFKPPTQRIVEIVCCFLSVATMAYTGVFLASQPGIPFWNSPALVVLFLCSSLSCGISLTLLIDYFINDQTILLRAAKPLQLCHLGCIAVETLAIAAFVCDACFDPKAKMSFNLLLSPDMISMASVGVLGLGVAAPALLEAYSLTQKECRTIPIADAMCLCGGLILRYCIIACGVH